MGFDGFNPKSKIVPFLSFPSSRLGTQVLEAPLPSCAIGVRVDCSLGLRRRSGSFAGGAFPSGSLGTRPTSDSIQNPKSSSADTRVPARVRNRRQHGTCRHQSHGWTRALCEQVANGETCETDSPTGDVPNELCLTEFGVSGQRRLSVGGAIARGWGSEARDKGEQKARNAKRLGFLP